MKKTPVESGVKRGARSGPSVRAISDPSTSCLSQILETPSRLDAKAQSRPSGEMAGAPSCPEDVMYVSRGGERGGGAVRRPTMAPRTRRITAPAARGTQRDAPFPAGLAVG